jgi:hypothetical protein
VKILNISSCVKENQLKSELNRLFNNSIISLGISLDPAYTSFGVAFATFDSIQAKDICLNLMKQNKIIFPEYNSITWQQYIHFYYFF